MSQEEVFLSGEGDRWYSRNREHIRSYSPDRDPCLRLLSRYELAPSSVLEVGAATGFRLAAIRERFGALVVGTDISKKAVAAGRHRHPDIHLIVGTASALPIAAAFDIVIVNFVFHWIDRDSLLRTVAEVDRMVRDEGFLIIGDFLPFSPLRVPYHHVQENVYTYKQEYGSIFESSNLYQTVATLTGAHVNNDERPVLDEQERVGTTLLQKSTTSYYRETALKRTPVDGQGRGSA